MQWYVGKGACKFSPSTSCACCRCPCLPSAPISEAPVPEHLIQSCSGKVAAWPRHPHVFISPTTMFCRRCFLLLLSMPVPAQYACAESTCAGASHTVVLRQGGCMSFFPPQYCWRCLLLLLLSMPVPGPFRLCLPHPCECKVQPGTATWEGEEAA